MKRPWTRGEKWLFATPLLLGVAALGLALVPRLVHDLARHPSELPTPPGAVVTSIALSRDGRLLVASQDRYNKPSAITDLVQSFDGRTLGPLPSFWGSESNFNDETWNHAEGVSSVALSDNGHLLAANVIGMGLVVYDLAGRRKLWFSKGWSTQAAFSPDSKWIAFDGSPKTVHIAQARTGKVVASWSRTPGSGEAVFAFSPAGEYFASKGPWLGKNQRGEAPGDMGGHIELWRVSDWQIERVLPLPNAVEIALSPDGRQLIGLGLWGKKTRSEIAYATSLRCFNTVDGTIEWEIDFRKPKTDFRLFLAEDICYSPDGRMVAFDCRDHGVILLDAQTGKLSRTLSVPRGKSWSGGGHSLAFAPDGKRLFLRGKSAVLLWDLD